jgi:hypothetical protein
MLRFLSAKYSRYLFLLRRGFEPASRMSLPKDSRPCPGAHISGFLSLSSTPPPAPAPPRAESRPAYLPCSSRSASPASAQFPPH